MANHCTTFKDRYHIKVTNDMFLSADDAWLLDVHSLTWIEIDAFKQMR